MQQPIRHAGPVIDRVEWVAGIAAADLDGLWRSGKAAEATAATWLIRRADGTLIGGRGCHSPTPLFYPASGTRDPAAISHSLRASIERNVATAGVDVAALGDYLGHGFVPAPRTLVDGIAALVPGTELNLSTPRRSRTLVPADDAAVTDAPLGAAAANFGAQLSDRISRSPATAVLLSGGVDSALIAALAKHAGKSVTAYHIRLHGIPADKDEDTHCARAVARHLGLDYREIVVGPASLWCHFGRVAAILDQPFGDPVVLPFERAFRAIAADGHRHVLTGEGADQLFGSWAMKPMLLRRAMPELGFDLHHAYLESFHKFTDEVPSLLAPSLQARWRGADTSAIAQAFGSAPTNELATQLRWVDTQLKGLQHIVPRINAAAAAHGVAACHPYFDAGLVRSVGRLPELYKLEKVLLKHAAGRLLPATVVDRRKAGMGVPATQWLKLWCRPLVWGWLARQRQYPDTLLSSATCRQLIRGEHPPRDSRARRWGDRLWQLMVLEAWWRNVRHTSSTDSECVKVNGAIP